MLVRTRQRLSRLPMFDVTIYDETLDNVSSYNYLGVMFDSQLAFTLHLTELSKKKKVQSKEFQLSKIRKYITR